MPAERLKLPDVISETSHSDKIPNIGVNQVAKTSKTAVLSSLPVYTSFIILSDLLSEVKEKMLLVVIKCFILNSMVGFISGTKKNKSRSCR